MYRQHEKRNIAISGHSSAGIMAAVMGLLGSMGRPTSIFPKLGIQSSPLKVSARSKTPPHIVAELKDRADLKRTRKNQKRLSNALAGGWA